ncbi:hypothetical protein SAMN04489726_8021 [Allokutzneria albata]|uniref:Uncharacterized protein n=1 Tax=Allokutzneria albata TaxID=211114 RepID=A0A1H0DVS0_ALLAB|nr:hypothetical protein SAMN04489726_8021 [Allokutzneria albata]
MVLGGVATLGGLASVTASLGPTAGMVALGGAAAGGALYVAHRKSTRGRSRAPRTGGGIARRVAGRAPGARASRWPLTRARKPLSAARSARQQQRRARLARLGIARPVRAANTNRVGWGAGKRGGAALAARSRARGHGPRASAHGRTPRASKTARAPFWRPRAARPARAAHSGTRARARRRIVRALALPALLRRAKPSSTRATKKDTKRAPATPPRADTSALKPNADDEWVSPGDYRARERAWNKDAARRRRRARLEEGAARAGSTLKRGWETAAHAVGDRVRSSVHALAEWGEQHATAPAEHRAQAPEPPRPRGKAQSRAHRARRSPWAEQPAPAPAPEPVGGHTMPEFGLREAAHKLATFAPENPVQTRDMLRSLPDEIREVGNAFLALATLFESEYPYVDLTPIGFREVQTLIGAAVARLEPMSFEFELAHEADLKRHLEPRRGERHMNV